MTFKNILFLFYSGFKLTFIMANFVSLLNRTNYSSELYNKKNVLFYFSFFKIILHLNAKNVRKNI